MKRTTFNTSIWLTMPHSILWAAQTDLEGRRIKELILNNDCADALRVSEMNLNITKFSAFDNQGKEHYIMDFPGQSSVQIKGMGSGHFIRSSSVVYLTPGTYTTLRYYLTNENNRFTYSDGDIETANDFDYLDFRIQNGLTLEGGEATEVKLWFDFAPYGFSRHYNPIKEWFKTWRNPIRRLANSPS